VGFLLELSAMSQEKEPLKKWVHDLNNRIGIILATAELLQLDQLPAKAAQRSRDLEREALAARDLLRQIAQHYLG
jgi:hypothetical protein